MKLLPWLLVLATLGPVPGCTPTTGQVERALARRLPEVIGPADRYDVDVEGLRARDGTADRVSAAGERVRPEGAPALDRLHVDLYGVTYDRDAERLEHVDSVRAAARVTAEDLAAFLAAYRNVGSATVTLEPPDRATLRVRPSLGDIPLPRGLTVEMTGRLGVDDGRVHFDVSEVEAAGAHLGGRVLRHLTRAVNPLVDLTELALPLRVTAVYVEDGAVRLEAEGRGPVSAGP